MATRHAGLAHETVTVHDAEPRKFPHAQLRASAAGATNLLLLLCRWCGEEGGAGDSHAGEWCARDLHVTVVRESYEQHLRNTRANTHAMATTGAHTHTQTHTLFPPLPLSLHIHRHTHTHTHTHTYAYTYADTYTDTYTFINTHEPCAAADISSSRPRYGQAGTQTQVSVGANGVPDGRVCIKVKKKKKNNNNSNSS